MFIQIKEWTRTYLNTVPFNQTITEQPLKILPSTVPGPRKKKVNLPDTAPIQEAVVLQKHRKISIPCFSFFQ